MFQVDLKLNILLVGCLMGLVKQRGTESQMKTSTSLSNPPVLDSTDYKGAQILHFAFVSLLVLMLAS